MMVIIAIQVWYDNITQHTDKTSATELPAPANFHANFKQLKPI